MNSIINKFIILIAAMVTILIGTASEDTSFVFSILLCCVFSLFILHSQNTFRLKKQLANGFSSGCVFLLSVINILLFYIRWHDNDNFKQFFFTIGINAQIAACMLSLLGLLASFYFFSWFCCWFQSQNKETTLSQKWMIGCYVLILAGFLIELISCFGKGIWVDEAFTLGLIKHPYNEVISLTAADVHPPLYYILLKIWVDAWNLFLPAGTTITVAKIFSMLPGIILAVLSITKIRKIFGDYVAATWILATLSMSYLISNGVEIRMYSWALLFVSLSLIEMYEILHNNNTHHWIIFVLSSLSAAYTHYYACIAVSILYIGMFLWFLIKKHSGIKNWIIASLLTVMGYLPWLFVFLKQAKTVSGNYWINEIGTRTIVSYTSYLFDNNIILVLIILLIIHVLMNKKILQTEHYTGILGILIPLWIIFIGVIASVLIRPVFVIRYVIPGISCMWLGTIILVKLLHNTTLQKLLVLLLVCSFAVHTCRFVQTEQLDASGTGKLLEMIKQNKSAVYVTDNSHVQRTIQVLSNSNSYLCNRDPEKLDDITNDLYTKVYADIGEITSTEQLTQLIDTNSTVYYIECVSSPSVKEYAATNNISYSFIGNYYLEYPINVYLLENH